MTTRKKRTTRRWFDPIRLLLPCLFGLLLVPVGCHRPASDEIGFGFVTNSVYRNDYFGMRVAFPPQWTILDQKAQQERAQEGISLAAGQDANLRRLLKASELKSVPLFAVYKKPPGSPPPNAIISAVAERLEDPAKIRRGSDYLEQARELIKSSQLTAAFPQPVYSEQFGGVEFDVLEVDIFMEGKKVRQRHYCRIAKGYAVGIVIAFTADQDAALLADILNTLTFDTSQSRK